MTTGIKQLAQQLAKASKNQSQPLTIDQSNFAIKTLVEIMANELVQPEGRVEIENFIVLLNKPYNQTGLSTRRIELRVSPHLKKRLKANTNTVK